MKKLKITLLVLALCLGMATTGWSIMITSGPYDGTDVGGLDGFMGSVEYKAAGYPNSNPTTEESWVSTILGAGSATYSIKDEPVPYYGTDAAGVFAFALGNLTTEYFLVKNATYWALFANNADMGWGVFNYKLLPAQMNIPSSSYQISHVTQFDGLNQHNQQNPAPEPSTILLLGLGLAGLAGFGRNKLTK